MWMTDDQLEQPGHNWWKLRSHPRLVPVLLDTLEDVRRPGEGRRPWDSELVVWDTDVSGIDTVSNSLRDEDPDNRKRMLPFTVFPGLAKGETEELQNADIEREVKSSSRAWIGLVPATRAADVPLNIGWFSTSDAFTLGSWLPSNFTAVLRSWEDRFGARVFRLGFAEMRLLVTRPPRSIDAALAVASEFFDLASEFHREDGLAIDSVQEIGESIVGSPWWTFWWD
jgi:hypothetical protein